jgi:lipooligosaccharide transport system permease protein
MTAIQQIGASGRILPVRLGGKRSLLLVERNLYVYRHTWTMLVSGFFEPLFYLLSVGLGIGGLIGTVPGPGGAPIPYALFVAPALLATASMNGAITEATMNFFRKLNYDKVYSAILATPVSPGDVALGEIGWAVMRSALYAFGFLVVLVIMGLFRSPLVLLAVPAATLLAFAFASVGMAATTWMRSWQDFDLVNLVTMPLFLFSGTFYPISAYPEPLRIFVMATPLWQGVDLIRGLVTGVIEPSALWHVVYLLAMSLIGLYVVSRRLDKLLRK